MPASAKCAARHVRDLDTQLSAVTRNKRQGMVMPCPDRTRTEILIPGSPRRGRIELRSGTGLFGRLSVYAVRQASAQGLNRPFKPGQSLTHSGHVAMQIPQEQQNSGNPRDGHIIENLPGHPLVFSKCSVNIQCYMSPAVYRLSRLSPKAVSMPRPAPIRVVLPVRPIRSCTALPIAGTGFPPGYCPSRRQPISMGSRASRSATKPAIRGMSRMPVTM